MTERLNTDSLITAIGIDIYDFNAVTEVETVRRFGSTKFQDMAGNSYTSLIANTGVQLGNQINDTLGGLQSLVWTAVVNLVNTAHITDLINYNTLINNRLDIRMFLWDNLSGSIVEELTLYSGKIKSREYTDEIWSIHLEHIVTDLIQSFPNLLISPLNYPRSAPDNFGVPVPHVFGNMNIGPFDGKGLGARLAKCIDISNSSQGGFLASYIATTRNELFEYNAGAWYEVTSSENGLVLLDTATGTAMTDDSDGNITTILSSGRKYRNYPAFATTNSRLDGWEVLVDGRNDSSIELESNLASGQFFEALFSQSTDRGIIQSAQLVIERRGDQLFVPDWGVTLQKEGVSVLSANANDIDITTDPLKFVHELDISNLAWSDLALLTLRVPRLDVDITQIYLEIEFLRKEDDTLPDIYQKITGYDESNPILQILLLLKESTLCNIDTQYIDEATFTEAAIARSDWDFSFQVNTILSKEFINSLLQECSAFLYIRNNKIACGVRTNIQEPIAAILDPPDIRYSGQGVFCDFLPENRIVNDIALRYGLESASGKYFNIEIASSLFRADSPIDVTETNGRWTSAELNNNPPVVGDTIFDFNTGKSHTVTEVGTGYVEATPTPNIDGKIVYGPNIAPKSVRSRYINKVSRSMGGDRPNFSELGSYNNAFIHTEATAKLWVNNVLDALAQPPLVSKLATYWKYALLNTGDTVLVDSPAFPDHARPGTIGTLTYNIPNTAGWKIIILTNASVANIGDYLLIDTEVMRIQAKMQNGFWVERGALQSRIAEHKAQTAVKLFTSKFQVKNKASNLNGLAWSLTVERVTPYYIPISTLGTTREIAPSDPTQQELSSNFYGSSESGLINEIRFGLFGSRTAPMADRTAVEAEEETQTLSEFEYEIGGF